MRIMGFHRDGGFAEYVAAPRPTWATAARAALAKLEEWVAAQAGGPEQRTAGEARLAALLGEAGLAG